MLVDSFGRQISDLRISVTDRCNFKCFYCKTAKGVNYLSRDRLLSYEEIRRLARLLVELGIRKIRVTGGEPLLRQKLEVLIRCLADLPRLEDLALTTNGFNLSAKVRVLREAGLQRVTVSLDSLREDRFFEITKSRDFRKVLKGIQEAKDEGLNPLKVNCVVVRGFNDDEILDFVHFAHEMAVEVRFIEFMPIGEDENWSRDKVVTGAEVLAQIESTFGKLRPVLKEASATSISYRLSDGLGGIGLIMPVSRPFCGECSRLRLTADGHLRTCLFSHVEHDVRRLLRGGASDGELEDFIVSIVSQKEAGHRINEPGFVPPRRPMSYLGG